MSQITPCLWRKELEGGGGIIMPEGYEQADPKEKAGIGPIVVFSESPKDLNFKYMCTSPTPNFVLLDSIE